MASETEITVRGHLGHNPDLQVSPGKKPFLKLRVATNRRVRNGDVWSDGPTSWYDVKLWDDFAENAAASMRKGDAVIVQGELTIEEYTNANNVTFRTPVITAHAFGPDVRHARVHVVPVQRSTAQGEFEDTSPSEDEPEEEAAGTAEATSAGLEAAVDVSRMEELTEQEEKFFATV